MEEYDDNIGDDEALYVQNGEWALKEATQLINKYNLCKTAHAKNRLRLQLEYILQRIAFEKKEIGKLLGYDEV
jgi:hypothetical protein